MKVVLIHPHYRPDGGAEAAVVHTLKALALKGAQVSIISRQWSENRDDHHLIRCNPFFIGRLWREWGFAKRAEKIIRTLQVDIVQSQVRLVGCDVYRAGGGVHREWLRQRDRVSSIFRRYLTKFSAYHLYKLSSEKKLYADERLKAVICNSHMVGGEIKHYFGVPDEKIYIIYNAVNLKRFNSDANTEQRESLRKKLGIANDKTVFLFVGSGYERKGLSILLECISELSADCCLLVVGKEPRIRKYYRKCKRLNIADRVIFAGLQKDIAPYYAAADGFVLPTLYDAFANSVLEAMAASLPVITSLKCGAVDIIDNGRNGFVCDSLDKQMILGYMNKLRDPESRKLIGNEARKTVETFTAENLGCGLYELYEKILD